MPNPIDVGTGLTVTFGTSGFSAYLLDFGGPKVGRAAVDTTHYATTGGRTFRPGDLYDGGEITLEVAFDPDLTPPMLAQEQPETITVTWPLPSGKSTAASWSFSAFLTNYEPKAPLEDRMTASLTLKITGSITRNASA